MNIGHPETTSCQERRDAKPDGNVLNRWPKERAYPFRQESYKWTFLVGAPWDGQRRNPHNHRTCWQVLRVAASYSVLPYPCKSWPPNPAFKCNPEGFRNLGCPARERKRERTENVIHLATPPRTDTQLETTRPRWWELPVNLSFYLLNWRGNFSYWMETTLGSESNLGNFFSSECLTKTRSPRGSSRRRGQQALRWWAGKIHVFSASLLLSFSFSRLNLKWVKIEFCFEKIIHHKLIQANKNVKCICFWL